MTEKMIRDAYCRIRTIDQTIPDDVLDFMKDAALEKLNKINENKTETEDCPDHTPYWGVCVTCGKY